MPKGEPQHHHESFQELCVQIGSTFSNLYKLKKHLEQLGLCTLCLSVLEEIDTALDFLQHDDATLAEEARTCHDGYTELMQLGVTERRQAIQSYTPVVEADLCTWGLVTLLLQKAREDSPLPLCREQAELAGLIFKRLDSPTYGHEYLCDLGARIHTTRAHLELRTDDPFFAEAEIVCARQLAAQGTGMAHEMVERMAITCLEVEGRGDEAEDIRGLLEAGPETHLQTLENVRDVFLDMTAAATERLVVRTRRHRRRRKERPFGLRFHDPLL